MEQQKVSFKSNKHIYILGFIAILFSLTTGLPNIFGWIVWAILPLISSILFMVVKHPIFGIICTISFISNRILLFFGEGTLLALFIISLIIGYYVYVVYLSIKDWKIRRNRKLDTIGS